MKDSKIDTVLDEHLNDYNVTIESKQTESLLGCDFSARLLEKFEEFELEDIMDDAKEIMLDYLKNKKVTSSKERPNITMYRNCLLESFLLRPDLNVSDRKLYVDIYMKSTKVPNKGHDYNHEEEIARKAVLWFREYKKQKHDIDPEYAFEIAILAINDQVYSRMFKEKPEKEKSKIIQK